MNTVKSDMPNLSISMNISIALEIKSLYKVLH